MKILAIMGSHRKNGSTYRVVKKIEENLKSFGGGEFNYLFLPEAKLEMCRGCGLCLSVGDDECPLKDDRELIERRILDSDGVILASPVYANNMTTLMKNFMDRFAFTMHRPRFFKQYTLIVAVSRGSGLKETIASISSVKYCGFNIVDSLGLGIYDFDKVSKKTKMMIDKKILTASKRFYKTVNEKIPYAPSLDNLLQFRAQQAVVPLLKSYQPYDYAYGGERGWFDKKRRYYVDAKINPIKDWMANVIAGTAHRYVNKELRNIQNEKVRLSDVE